VVNLSIQDYDVLQLIRIDEADKNKEKCAETLRAVADQKARTGRTTHKPMVCEEGRSSRERSREPIETNKPDHIVWRGRALSKSERHDGTCEAVKNKKKYAKPMKAVADQKAMMGQTTYKQMTCAEDKKILQFVWRGCALQVELAKNEWNDGTCEEDKGSKQNFGEPMKAVADQNARMVGWAESGACEGDVEKAGGDGELDNDGGFTSFYKFNFMGGRGEEQSWLGNMFDTYGGLALRNNDSLYQIVYWMEGLSISRSKMTNGTWHYEVE